MERSYIGGWYPLSCLLTRRMDSWVPEEASSLSLYGGKRQNQSKKEKQARVVPPGITPHPLSLLSTPWPLARS